MNYDDRIVCFIDILSFKNIINATVNSENKDIKSEIENVNDVLLLARDVLDIDVPCKISKSKVVTQFSDSIVISFNVEEESEIFYTLTEILHLIMNFVKNGILIRGGISYGKLIHNEKIVFGPGLISAYEMESKAALYPRVILDKSIIEIAKFFHSKHADPDIEEEFLMEMVTMDTDDMYYIDYIEKAKSELDEPELEMPSYIDCLKAIIDSNKNYEAPDIKVKIGWLINKYNRLITPLKGIKFIKSLRKEGNIEFADYYDQLEIIE